jgi:sterol 14-demethylase
VFTETDGKLNIREPYGFLRAMFGDVLFLAPHESYLRQRPLLGELFRRDKLVQYVDIMDGVIERWVEGLGETGELELTETMTWLVKQVVGSCFLGPDVNERIGDEFWDLYGDLSKAIDPVLPPKLPHPKFIRRDRAKARMTEILRPVIAERRANPDHYDDFLQDLVRHEDKDGQPVTEDFVRNLLLGLMFAGHETTAGQAAWTLILLAQHPEYLRAVRDEVDTVSPGEEPFDIGKVVELRHLAWAVREVERLCPSVDLVMRLVEQDLSFGEYVVPAGWLVQTAQTLGHRLPAYFESPEAFDPYRHAPGRAEDKQDGYLMCGFGGGMHRCTGMNFANYEQAIIAARVFRKLDLELVTPDPQVLSGLGANHPSKTVVRYRKRARRPEDDRAGRALDAATTAARAGAALGCPMTNRARVARSASGPGTRALACPVAHGA